MVVLTSFSPPTENIVHEQPSTKLFVSDREIGCGTLYITESQFSWRNQATGEGFSLLYPHIAVHAISRDIQRFGSECLIIMVDTNLDDMQGKNEEEEDSEDEGGMTEMRFVPDDKNQLETMYQAMTHCQSLHPDPNDSFSEDDEFIDANEDGNDSWAGGDSEYIEGPRSMNGHRVDQQGDEEMETDGQFEDAEDD
jgi:nucleotide-sensitive chloride channel 1A